MTYRVYKIIHRLEDGSAKLYVGLTNRSLKTRWQAHLNQLSRKKGRAVGSLGEALYLAHPDDPKFSAFSVHELETFTTLEDMAAAEERYIEALGTMAPKGYNLMRGGASVGGPSNSKPVTVDIAGEPTQFSSMSALCRHLVEGTSEDPEKFYFKVMARYSAGWTLAEAVELEKRIDGRKTLLSLQAAATGGNLDSMRSRRWREANRHTLAVGTVSLPNPVDRTAAKVSAARFALLAKISKSTVLRRLSQIKKKLDRMSDEAIIDHLKTQQERAHRLTVVLEEGHAVTGTKNELAERFSKIVDLSSHTLRRRLRKLTSDSPAQEIRVALGLQPDATKPRRVRELEPLRRRKVHCDDYTVTDAAAAVRFVSQARFLDACLEVMRKYGVTHRAVHGSPQDQQRRLQRWVSNELRLGSNPTKVATDLGVLRLLVHVGAPPLQPPSARP